LAELRVSIGHYNEILLFIEREHEKPFVQEFVASLPEDVRSAYDDARASYAANRAIANRLRNEAIFHYPDQRGIEAMRRAFRDLVQDGRGGVTSSSGKIRDARLHYADEVMAAMTLLLSEL
jgi:hypothetical protein